MLASEIGAGGKRLARCLRLVGVHGGNTFGLMQANQDFGIASLRARLLQERLNLAHLAGDLQIHEGQVNQPARFELRQFRFGGNRRQKKGAGAITTGLRAQNFGIEQLEA
jgi:hypothetical protein